MGKGGTFVPDGNESPFEAVARGKLEGHRHKLVELFGKNYAQDPRFRTVVLAVANGREPWLVLADYAPLPLPYKEPGDDEFPKPTDGGVGAFT